MERADRVAKAADARDTRDMIAAQKTFEKTKAQEADATRYTKGTPNAAAFKAKEIQIAKDVGKGLRPFSDLSPAARKYGPAGSNKQRIGTILEKRGFSDKQISAVLGNFKVESNFDPNAVGDGGYAHGIGQWNDQWSPERGATMRARYGAGAKTVEGQANFAADELQGQFNTDPRTGVSGPDAGAKKAMRDMQKADISVGDMARSVRKNFERPNPKLAHEPARVAAAEDTFKSLGVNSAPNVQVADNSPTPSPKPSPAPKPKQTPGSPGAPFEKKTNPKVENAVPDFIHQIAPTLIGGAGGMLEKLAPGMGDLPNAITSGDETRIKSGITGFLERLMPSSLKALPGDMTQGNPRKTVQDGFNGLVEIALPPGASDIVKGFTTPVLERMTQNMPTTSKGAGAQTSANGATKISKSGGSGTSFGNEATRSTRSTRSASIPAGIGSGFAPSGGVSLPPVVQSIFSGGAAAGIAPSTIAPGTTFQNAAYVTTDANGNTFVDDVMQTGSRSWADAGKEVLTNSALPSLYSFAWVIVALALIIIGIIVVARRNQVIKTVTDTAATVAAKGAL